jgi:hypothetical protein
VNNFDRNAAEKKLAEAVASFPATFGLRAFPGDVFRVGPHSSYVNDSGEPTLYTEVRRGDQWLSFAKGTPAELRCEIVALPHPFQPKVYAFPSPYPLLVECVCGRLKTHPLHNK